MSDYVTKKDLGQALEKHQKVILDAVGFGFDKASKERKQIKEKVDKTWNVLDGFVGRLTTLEQEVGLLNKDVEKISRGG